MSQREAEDVETLMLRRSLARDVQRIRFYLGVLCLLAVLGAVASAVLALSG